MFFPTGASVNGVRVSGPEAISSVKICAFQWPSGAAVVGRLAGVRFCAVPAGRGWSGGWERGAVVVSGRTVTSLNYLLTGWLEFAFVQIYCRYIPEQMVCLPLDRRKAIFSAHYIYLFPPNIYMYK